MGLNTRIAQRGFPGRVDPAPNPFMLLAGTVSMIEKTLHAGNIAVAIASAATAADLNITGGAGAAITTMLSGVELFNKSTKDQKSLAKSMAAEIQNHLDGAHLTPDRRKITVQMLERFPPGKTDLAAGNMDAPTIAANMCAQIRATPGDGAHRTPTALEDYTAILTATLTPYLEPQTEEQAMLQELLARTDALLKQSENSGQFDRLRDEGITEMTIIRLAQRSAADIDDLGQAWLELQNVMDIAVRVQQEGRFTTNHGDFVDEVLKRVADLTAVGEYANARFENAQALADEETSHAKEKTAHQVRKTRLLNSGINLAMLDGDYDEAASLMTQKADLEAGGRASFEFLRSIQDFFYERGRDRGGALDLAISISLAQRALHRASTNDERGSALNDLAVSLWVLGERERGTERLEDAVTAFRDTLKVLTRERVPHDWAMAQNNLGNVLQTLGEREKGNGSLEDAVTAYRAALEVYTRDYVPADWAMSQNNLGTALTTLGERGNNKNRLKEAIIACKNALKVWTKHREPHLWTKAQNNLGNAISALGKLENDTALLKEAETTYRAALDLSADKGLRVQWASALGNLAELELAFFGQIGNSVHLDQAMKHANSARALFEEIGASQFLKMIDSTIIKIIARRD